MKKNCHVQNWLEGGGGGAKNRSLGRTQKLNVFNFEEISVYMCRTIVLIKNIPSNELKPTMRHSYHVENFFLLIASFHVYRSTNTYYNKWTKKFCTKPEKMVLGRTRYFNI